MTPKKLRKKLIKKWENITIENWTDEQRAHLKNRKTTAYWTGDWTKIEAKNDKKTRK